MFRSLLPTFLECRGLSEHIFKGHKDLWGGSVALVRLELGTQWSLTSWKQDLGL